VEIPILPSGIVFSTMFWSEFRIGAQGRKIQNTTIYTTNSDWKGTEFSPMRESLVCTSVITLMVRWMKT
jgi:hypothetical protein